MDIIVKQIEEIKLLQYCQLAAAIIIIYEQFITFHQEIELIWRKKWSLVKCIFICNRYVGGGVSIGNAIVFLCNPTSENVCRSWAWVQAIGGYIALWAMQGILQLRAHAMASPYPSPLHVPIRHVMTFAFVCEAIAMWVILGFSYAHISSKPVYFSRPPMSICAPSGVELLWAIWIPAAVFESLLTVCVLWIAFRHLTSHTHGVFSSDSGRKVLWQVLLRDSVVFPAISVSMYIANAILWSTLPPELVQVPECFVACATCVLGSRLVLNLRDAYYMPFEDEVRTAARGKLDSYAVFSTRSAPPRMSLDWRVAPNPNLEGGTNARGRRGDGEPPTPAGIELPTRSRRSQSRPRPGTGRPEPDNVASPSSAEPGTQFRYLPQGSSAGNPTP